MKEVLKNMLQGILIVPYDESVINELTQVCQNYAIENDFGHEDFEELVYALLTNTPQVSLLETLEQNYKSETSNEIKLPKCTWEALAVFILYVSINASTSDNEEKAIYSAILMNYMILRKGSLNTIPFKKYLIQLYGYFDSYWGYCGKVAGCDDSELLSNILNDSGFIENVGIDADKQSELESIANDAAKFRINQLMHSSELKKDKNPFTRTYCGLIIFSENLPWLYLDYTIRDLLADLLPQHNYKSKKLREILDDIRNMENYTALGFISQSSILLRLLHCDSRLEDILILEEEFSPKEFCVYLYYELMLENKLKDYNDGE